MLIMSKSYGKHKMTHNSNKEDSWYWTWSFRHMCFLFYPPKLCIVLLQLVWLKFSLVIVQSRTSQTHTYPPALLHCSPGVFKVFTVNLLKLDAPLDPDRGLSIFYNGCSLLCGWFGSCSLFLLDCIDSILLCHGSPRYRTTGSGGLRVVFGLICLKSHIELFLGDP